MADIDIGVGVRTNICVIFKITKRIFKLGEAKRQHKNVDIKEK